MGNMWDRGQKNVRKVWRMKSKRCIDIEGQNMEVKMREEKSLILCHSLETTWEKEEYVEIYARDESLKYNMVERRVMRVEGVCWKEEEFWSILECEGTKEWREEILNMRLRNSDPIMGVQKVARCSNREDWHRIGS
jgi:hypothetical protein